MNVVDANVLLYAINSDAPRHETSRRWLDDALNGGATVGFAWIVMLAFLRLATKPGLFPRPLAAAAALDQLDAWTAQPTATVIHPTSRHLTVVHRLLTPLGTAGNLVNDVHLAALSIEHRGRVVSYDSDFARLPGVRWHAP